MFRSLVKSYQAPYLKAKKKEKPVLAASIVKTIQRNNGRFLKKDLFTGAYYKINDEKAKDKTCQALVRFFCQR